MFLVYLTLTKNHFSFRGGTSTDEARYNCKFYQHVSESEIAGITLQAPQLDIKTISSGGGSRLFFNNGMYIVGPESTSS